MVPGTEDYRQLTDAVGYDAEASYSPDGSQIVFASNRAAYSQPLIGRAKEMFEVDPAYMIDIYIMNADGDNVRQLTDVRGYDGGTLFLVGRNTRFAGEDFQRTELPPKSIR